MTTTTVPTVADAQAQAPAPSRSEMATSANRERERRTLERNRRTLELTNGVRLVDFGGDNSVQVTVYADATISVILIARKDLARVAAFLNSEEG